MSEEQVTEARRYPVDFDGVEVGRFFMPEEIAEMFGTEPGTEDHRFKCMQFGRDIERRLARRAVPLYVTCRTMGDGVKVLTQEEASNYNTRKANLALRSMGVAVCRLGKVDTSGFSDRQRQIHENNLARSAQMYLSARRGRREALSGGSGPAVPKAIIAPEDTHKS